MSDYRANAYLVLKARRDHTNTVLSVRADRVTQSKPKLLTEDEIAVKLKVTVPTRLFEPAVVINVDVPKEAIVVRPIEAEVEQSDD